MEYIRTEGLRAGLAARYDAVGNLFLRTKGQYQQIVQIGSHLDTVPSGGNYDGALGIVSGLEAILAVKDLPRKRELELVVWRGEESTAYGIAHKGASLAFGNRMPEGVLQRTFRGKTLRKAIVEQGNDPSFVEKSKPTIDQEAIDSIYAHLELHIEQAKKLEIDKDDIGIVTSIRGPARFRVEIHGKFDHSGATPMGPRYRKDANLAIAHTIVSLDYLSEDHMREGHDLVQTIGVLNSDLDFNRQRPILFESAITKVSAFGYFLLDIRSNDKASRDKYVKKAQSVIGEVSKKLKTKFEISPISSSDPAEALDEHIQKTIERSSKKLRYRFQHMPSGAGHDAAVVAKQKRSSGVTIPVGMIFVPSVNGKSHCPEEFTKLSDVGKGANVLGTTTYALANE